MVLPRIREAISRIVLRQVNDIGMFPVILSNARDLLSPVIPTRVPRRQRHVVEGSRQAQYLQKITATSNRFRPAGFHAIPLSLFCPGGTAIPGCAVRFSPHPSRSIQFVHLGVPHHLPPNSPVAVISYLVLIPSFAAWQESLRHYAHAQNSGEPTFQPLAWKILMIA
jgi:hypothetical protein